MTLAKLSRKSIIYPRQFTSEEAYMRAKTLQYLSPTPAVVYQKPDDLHLIRAYLAGDERAFTTLVRLYETRLLNFVYHMIGDREQAEDLVQETFVRVWKHAHRFDQKQKFSTWVYTIASNLAKNELRNRSRKAATPFSRLEMSLQKGERPFEFEDTKARPDEMYRKRHLRELVEDAIAQLPEHQRVVFTLYETEGRSYEETAQIAGCKLGTVKSRLFRARNMFAAIIEPHI